MYDESKEIREAVFSGEKALVSLKDAKRYLDSARNWGVVDIFGGDLFSGLMKHSNIDKASQAMDRAKHDLRDFQQELHDVYDLPDMHIDMGDFMTFADYFFDGFIVDFMVQSKINEARQQVNNAISRVEGILRQIRSRT
ncbi:hypothetical protein ACTQZS_07250 [Bilifractor sp. LCP19S3_H10]|uniref:hypothetical protein n=1 Tax=Bilifractor sp. LCP19S3_H10 TaxID=3438736 RepID=UPI003F901604